MDTPPDNVHIHITNTPTDSTLLPSKRNFSKTNHPTNRQTDTKRTKRSKRSDLAETPVTIPLTTKGSDSSPKPCEAPSLRHLFSFGASSNPTPPPLLPLTKPEKTPPEHTEPPAGEKSNFDTSRDKSFTFFDQGGESADVVMAHSTTNPPVSPESHRDKTVPVKSELSDTNSVSGSSLEDFDDIDLAHIHQVHRQTTYHNIYDDDAISEAAAKFYRTVTLDEIREQFEKEDGIRQLMKRDFKLKRQNVLRGRKLGATSAS